MAMPKARYVHRIERDETFTDEVRVSVSDEIDGPRDFVAAVSLTRAEIGRCLHQIGIDYPRDADKEVMRAMLVDAVKAPDFTPTTWTPREGAKREQSTDEQSTPKVDPAPKPTDAPASVRDWFRDVIGTQAVDREEVLSIVRDEIAKHGSVPITIVNTDGVKVREMEGLTHKAFQRVWRASIVAGNAVALWGPRGTGKSSLVRSVAEAAGRPYSSLAVTAGTMEHNILGYMDAAGKYVRSLFREAYENGGVFLFDELDFGTPEVLGVINDALAASVCAFPDGIVKKHPDFVAFAAMNTSGFGPTDEHPSRAALDPATLDRFVRIFVAIDEALEDAMVAAAWNDKPARETWLRQIRAWRVNVDRHHLHAAAFSLSPRKSVQYALLRAAGASHEEALEDAIFSGTPAEVIAKVCA